LPGVSKTLAYRIVNHRGRHGLFTHWEELTTIRDFPVEALDQLRTRAELRPSADAREGGFGPRRLRASRLARLAKKPKGYTKVKRSTRRPEKLKPPT
jgi:hypothetical protein